MTRMTSKAIAIAIVGMLALAACVGQDPAPTASADSSASASGPASASDPATAGLDLTSFDDGALVGDVQTTDCTLASGATTTCYELTIAGFPADRDSIGPWCPATTSDGAAGIWFDGSAVYDIDGQFILDLADIYDDATWKLYDDDGNVLSTDTSEKFNDLVTGGAQSGTEPVNLCVYGEIEWAEGGGPIAATVQIPVTPSLADGPTPVSGVVGVTLDGVRIESSAPIDLILGNYTIGAFDPCGGHVNPQEGYHMHATTGCSDAQGDTPDGETALFGYALDGYGIHAPYEAGSDADAGLDACNGHETTGLGYHYHANQVAENAVLTCFSGEAVATAAGGPPAGGQPPGPGPGSAPGG